MPNLLTNPDFEGPYRNWNGIDEVQVAQGWFPFWVGASSNNQRRRPVYQAVSAAANRPRVRTGSMAQTYHSDGAQHLAGLMQQIQARPGQRLHF
ncbi:MAG: hypothetical protein GYB68_13375, partial [Chloroflexi bacterium]|nr:hypothetical protein [Chloroflexota bacterium]